MVDDREASPAARRHQPRILLVEDNPLDVRSTIRAANKLHLGDVVSVVSDGQAALEHLRRARTGPQAAGLVLLDLNLPGKDGHDVLAEIRADPSLRTLPVVILTTSSDAADIEGAYRLGANAYITKPVTLEEWVQVVSTIREFWLTVAVLPDR